MYEVIRAIQARRRAHRRVPIPPTPDAAENDSCRDEHEQSSSETDDKGKMGEDPGESAAAAVLGVPTRFNKL